MNKYDLFDALGGVDDELLERSEHRTARRLPLRRALLAAAAVMLLAATVMAAPLLRELLFPQEPVQVSEGKRHIYGDLYRDIENDEYRIELILDSAAPLPTEIEEVRLPQYMIDHNWLVSYGEIDAVYSEGPVHFKWYDRDSAKWITFEQKCIPDGQTSFSLESYHGAQLERKTATIDGLEFVYYTVPSYYNQETREHYLRQTAVYWSDGEYAYHLQSSLDTPLEELARIVRSVGPVEDVTPYLKNDPNNDSHLLEYPPMDIYQMPTSIPDGYELKVCVEDDWHITWIWENAQGCTIRLTGAHSHITAELFTAELYKDHPGYAREELELDDRTVHSICLPDIIWLIWEDGDFCEAANANIALDHVYNLRWEGDDTATLDDILAIMDSMTEVDDISQYLTS